MARAHHQYTTNYHSLQGMHLFLLFLLKRKTKTTNIVSYKHNDKQNRNQPPKNVEPIYIGGLLFCYIHHFIGNTTFVSSSLSGVSAGLLR
jgi:hypothetical protein